MENDLRRWMCLVEAEEPETDYLWSPLMYHHTSRANRESIATHGLCKRFDSNADEEDELLGGVYLSTKNNGTKDTWEVDVRGLELDQDFTNVDRDEFGYWWVYYGDIPPSRLKRISPD